MTHPVTLMDKLDRHALSAAGDPAPYPYDFVYVERLIEATGEAIRVAFAGQSSDYPEARAFIAALTSRAKGE
jgi:hypothetical protein